MAHARVCGANVRKRWAALLGLEAVFCSKGMADWEHAYIERARSLTRLPARRDPVASSDGGLSSSDESSYDTFARPALAAPAAPSASKPSSLYAFIQHERQARRAAASVHQHMHQVADLLLACGATAGDGHRSSYLAASVRPDMRMSGMMSPKSIRNQADNHQGACRCKACCARKAQDLSALATISRASAADTADWRSPRSNSGGSGGDGGGGGDGHYFLTPDTLRYGAADDNVDDDLADAANAAVTVNRASNRHRLLSDSAMLFRPGTGSTSVSPLKHKAGQTPRTDPRSRETVDDYLGTHRNTTSPLHGASRSSGAAASPVYGRHQSSSYRPVSAPRAEAEQRSLADQQLVRLRGVLRSLHLAEIGGGETSHQRDSVSRRGTSSRLADLDHYTGAGSGWPSSDRRAPKPVPPPTPGAWQGPDGGEDSPCSRRVRSAQLVRKLKPFLDADRASMASESLSGAARGPPWWAMRF